MIRKIALLLLFFFFLIQTVMATGSSALDLRRMDLDLSFAPPHNEPVLSDMVGRYGFREQHQIHLLWRLTWEGENKLWGGQRWRTDIGHGIEAWRNSSWDVQAIQLDATNRLLLNLDKGERVYLFAEAHRLYYPFQAHDGFNSELHNLFGVRVRIQ